MLILKFFYQISRELKCFEWGKACLVGTSDVELVKINQRSFLEDSVIVCVGVWCASALQPSTWEPAPGSAVRQASGWERGPLQRCRTAELGARIVSRGWPGRLQDSCPSGSQGCWEKDEGSFRCADVDAAAAAKGLQSCLTLWDPIDGSPPGSAVPGILQAGTLEWAAISFSNAGKWKVKVKSLSHAWCFATPWTACSLPCSSVHGIFQARVLEWGAIAFSDTDVDDQAFKKAYPYG